MSTLRIAAAQYPIDAIASLAEYEAKLRFWVEDAARAGAQFLVFPEYAAMELAPIAGMDVARDLGKSTEALQSILSDADAIVAKLAAAHGVFILGASAPVRDGGALRNRARLFTPGGQTHAQDKQLMTRFEREIWGLTGGDALRVFDTPFGKVGVAICYDVEFPLVVRALTEAGAEIILAPSCTETLAGYWRVRVGAQARALENQCYVVQAPIVGEAPWSPAVDVNFGAAGVYAPPDAGLPDDGVIAKGALNTAQWLYADLDLARIRDARERGEQFNHATWPLQAKVPRVDVIPLS